MPRFSIVIPFYNGLSHIRECVDSVLSQDFEGFEVLIVDDRDPQRSGDALDSMFTFDSRVRVIHRGENGGTLKARRDGVLASSGEIVMLLDQDDCLAEGCLSRVDAEFDSNAVDILHFGARVLAENSEAAEASAGMEGFLTPRTRTLRDDEILVRQFAFDDGFDWHVHHKAYRGDFARACWSKAADVTLTLSDDLYLSFILSSYASMYRAVDAHWYLYHLGRGETLGGGYDLASLRRVSLLDRQAFELLQTFVSSPEEMRRRNDWEERLSDVRDHLIEHVANEMADNLPLSERDDAIGVVSRVWGADMLAGELWRFVRDRAYELFSHREYPKRGDVVYSLLNQARAVDADVRGPGSARYQAMKGAALRHLNDLESIGTLSQKLMRRLARRLGN